MLLKNEFFNYIKSEVECEVLKEYRNYLVNEVAYIEEYRRCLGYENVIPYEERDEEEEEEFTYQWEEISSLAVKNICSEMGWDYNSLVGEKQIQKSILADCCYVKCRYQLLWDKIQQYNDESFCYFSLILLKELNLRTEYGKRLSKGIKKGINKYGMKKWLDVFKPKSTVFVAMSYSEKLCDAREQIKRAIEKADYDPIFMDEKQYNNFIVPEMLKEIEKSVFVVADITQHRTGVYYEAGYAKALGKEIIFLCKKCDLRKAHFDIKQLNHLVWNDEDEIESLLYNRIEVTIGLGD